MRINDNGLANQVDVWAVGAILHWMLTAKLPWDAIIESQVGSDGQGRVS